MGAPSSLACAAVLVLAALCACSPQLDWRELRSAEGGFSVMLPGKPHYEERPLATQPAVTMHLWSVAAGGAVFGAGYADYPAGQALDLDRTARNLAANISGTITARRALTDPSGMAGEEFSAAGSVAGEPRELHARLWLLGLRFYELVVIAPRGALGPSARETFFSSFALLP